MSNGLLINEYNVFGIRNPPEASHLTDYAPQAWQTTDSAAVNWGTFSALKTKVDTFLDPQNGETIATALDSLGEIQTFLANDGGGFGTAIVSSLGLKADKATPIFSGDITFKDDSNNTVATIAGASGNTSFAGTLTVGGNTTLSGALGVAGASTFSGNVSIADTKTLTVGTGATTFGGTVTLAAAPSADLQAATKKYVDDAVGDIDFTTLAPKAGPTFTGTVTTDVLTSGGAFTASSTATISGNTTVGGTLGVTGVSTLAGITGTGTINLTGGTTTVATPTADSHASTKAYVDQVAQGLDVKQSCRVATTANITLNDVQDIDGVTLVADDRVLVKNQTTASENGIYVVVSGDDWTRATDFDGSDVTSGAFTFVEEGTVNADAGFVLSTNDSITVGTTDLAFTQFSGAGAITAGTGLSKSGNTLSVDAAQTGITSVGTLAGLTATGTIDLTGGTTTVATPSADTHASTKKYVDDSVAAVAALDSENALTIPAFTGSVTTNKLYNDDTNGISFNGNAIVTGTAASTNTASSIVKRDVSGNFTANIITAGLLITGGVTNATNPNTSTDTTGLDLHETYIYCDSNRTDSYTETGARSKPYKTLTAALTAKLADSDTTSYVFYLFPGTYTGVASHTKTTANQSFSIVGADRDSCIIQGSASWDNSIGNLLFFRKFNNITLSNVTLRHAAYGFYPRTCDKVRINNVHFTLLGSSGNDTLHNGSGSAAEQAKYKWDSGDALASHTSNGGAMRVRDCNWIEIHNNLIYKCFRGYRTQDVKLGGRIQNNRLHSVLDNGIYLAHGAYTADPNYGCYNVLVEGNYLENVGHHALLSIGSRNNVWKNNVVRGAWATGMNSAFSIEETVTDNHFIDCANKAYNGYGSTAETLGAVFYLYATHNTMASHSNTEYWMFITGNRALKVGNGTNNSSVLIHCTTGFTADRSGVSHSTPASMRKTYFYNNEHDADASYNRHSDWEGVDTTLTTAD